MVPYVPEQEQRTYAVQRHSRRGFDHSFCDIVDLSLSLIVSFIGCDCMMTANPNLEGSARDANDPGRNAHASHVVRESREDTTEL